MQTIAELKTELAQIVEDLEKVMAAEEIDHEERDFLFAMQESIVSSINAARKAAGMKASSTRKSRDFDAGFECAANGGDQFRKCSKEWMAGFESFFQQAA
jgi:hypothetical protein